MTAVSVPTNPANTKAVAARSMTTNAMAATPAAAEKNEYGKGACGHSDCVFEAVLQHNEQQ